MNALSSILAMVLPVSAPTSGEHAQDVPTPSRAAAPDSASGAEDPATVGVESRRDDKPLPSRTSSYYNGLRSGSSDLVTTRKRPVTLDEKLRSAERKNDRLSRELSIMERDLKKLQRSNDLYEQKARGHALKVQSLQCSLGETWDRSNYFEHATRQKDAQLLDVQRQHAALQTELEQKETLYVSQSLELRTAQTYLNTADSVPGARIIQAVRGLNSEIQNAAPMFAEEFEYAPIKDADSKRFKTANAHLAESGNIGEYLLHALHAFDNSEDPTLVQTAVQAMLISVSARYISGSLAPDGATQTVIRELYETIRANEVQAISGRWRALSARYLRLNSQDPSNSGNAASEALFNPITALFVISGCVDPPKEVRSVIKNKFGSKLDTIISQALALGTLIHEEVTSTDYEVIHILAKTPFDSAAADDEYADDDAKSALEKPILCTLELGLRQVTITGMPGTNTSRKGGAPQKTETLLIKPKIALESAIEKMFA